MDERKQTPADRIGRTKRKHRDPSPQRRQSRWNPPDDLFGEESQPVDRDLGLHEGRYGKRPRRPSSK